MKLTVAQRYQILRDYRAGDLSISQIAEKHGVTPSYPVHLARRRGIPRRAPQLSATMLERFKINKDARHGGA